MSKQRGFGILSEIQQVQRSNKTYLSGRNWIGRVVRFKMLKLAIIIGKHEIKSLAYLNPTKLAVNRGKP